MSMMASSPLCRMLSAYLAVATPALFLLFSISPTLALCCGRLRVVTSQDLGVRGSNISEDEHGGLTRRRRTAVHARPCQKHTVAVLRSLRLCVTPC